MAEALPLACRFATLASCLLLACLWAAESGAPEIIKKADIDGERFDGEITKHFVADAHNSFDKAKEVGKPVMVILTTEWCEACLHLRASLNKGMHVKGLLDYFVVANPGPDEKDVDFWKEQGHDYVPQVYFMQEDGHQIDVAGPSKEHKHYFYDDDSLAHAMLKALKAHGHTHLADEFDPDISVHIRELGHQNADGSSLESTAEKDSKDAKKERKPMMMLVSSKWCHACLKLRGSINAGERVRELLPSFSFAYAEGESAIQHFTEPGSDYIPQVHFFGKHGQKLEVTGPQSAYPSFFEDEGQLADAMEKALFASQHEGEL